MDEKPTATMRDVAEALGLSTATVSLALREHSRISQATRARVLAKAEEMGYRKDPALSALAESRWRGKPNQSTVNLGYLAVGLTAAQAQRSAVFAVIREEAEHWGYALIPLAADSGKALRQTNNQMVQMNVRGVVFHDPPGREVVAVEELEWKAAAWVQTLEGARNFGLHRVMTNTFQSTCMGLNNLHAAGYRRILFAHDRLEVSRVLRRQQAGFLLTRAEHPKSAWKDCAAERLWKTIERFRPEAVLTTYPALAEEVRTRTGLPCASLGITDPTMFPRLAGCNNHPQGIARAAIQLLDGMVRRGELGRPPARLSVMIDAVWGDGESLCLKTPQRETAKR